ncbi:MAG: class I SAM-dependent methyltransferase [Candidatus Puniceispirillaceae bacterium]
MSFTIENLPLYWRLSDYQDAKNTNNIVEANLDFSFSWDANNQLLIQKRNDYLLEALNLIYKQEYNIGYLQDANTLAENYGTDFFNFLIKTFDQYEIPSASLLEIGCGGCVLLEKFKQKGFKVTGIDSSPFATKSAKLKGINVIEDFFPSEKIIGKFDVIFCVDVLEHIDFYEDFLTQQINILEPNGLVIVNVPDATESIDKGDISLAMHQHLNYFSINSLKNLFNRVGLRDVHVEKANYGGSLYAVGRGDKSNSSKNLSKNDFTNDKTLKRYSKKGKITLRNIRSHILETYRANKTIGFYVPLRALPYVCNLPSNVNFRFFDDTPHWHEKKFDGMDVLIENMADLVSNPVDVIYIMSLTFGNEIRNKILTEFGDRIILFTLNDLIDGSK